MIYVNILTGFNHHLFIHQLDKNRYKGKIMFFENSNNDIIWDYVVVYECVKNNISFKCKKGGLIFITGEPPMSNPYSGYFFAQFDFLITVHPSTKHKNNLLSQIASNWLFGFSFSGKKYKYDFDELKRMNVPEKSKNISMICSNKTMLPGHTSGEVITTWAPDPTVPVQKTVKKPQSTAFKPERPITDFPVEPAVPTVKDNEEDSLEPILNIEDVDDIKKAVIYTEIFSRKNF